MPLYRMKCVDIRRKNRKVTVSIDEDKKFYMIEIVSRPTQLGDKPGVRSGELCTVKVEPLRFGFIRTTILLAAESREMIMEGFMSLETFSL